MPYDAAKDPTASHQASQISPARMMRVVVPSDVDDLSPYALSLWAYVPDGAAATVRVTPVGAGADDAAVPVTLGPGLQPLPPCQVRRVWATGTSAGVIIYALGYR